MAPAPTSESRRAALVRRALEEHESGLVGYARSLLGDLDLAQDVVQDTFLRLYEQEEGKVDESLKAWLFTVCRNRCLDFLRRRRRTVDFNEELLLQACSPGPDPSEAMERQEAGSEVMRVLERLPENQREVIRLKFQADLSYKEIAAVTGLSVSNVGFLIHTGLKRLRSLLAHRRTALQ